jgi:acyl transferase domain-containing protein/NADPH:quinone reductase-like Zn-dependent oxidoreductase/acyl carrier protein
MSDKSRKNDNTQNVAIIGVALRLPGDLASPASLWSALIEGADLVTQIDPARWATDALSHPKRAEPGRSVTFSAGVLSRIDAFDAGFFGISPREAELLDPQQRLLLELAWEALENANIPPSTLEGSDCGVYVGISGLDYGMRLLDDLSNMGAHSMTGNTLSIAANRLSYVFNLHGPSMAIDTACSSSLVALHQACSALASGHTSLALVGGANLLLHPYPFVGFTKASMLSAKGRCRAFAQGGDGYVRGEGAAMLVLKPLEQAEIDGDPIWGVIRGSGVNADGARKSGLTIPSSVAQAQLMHQVLERARLRPDEIDFIEAHGTGTRIGDPIEARAIGQVYGAVEKRTNPLPIGSVKSNLGHLEPASGMAGLLKALLALRHRTVPPSIHTQTLNPEIDFDGLNLKVAQQSFELPPLDRPLRAGVNSFGFGGVNAHVILEEYRCTNAAKALSKANRPVRQTTAVPLRQETPLPLVLSAKDEAALRALAAEYLKVLLDSEPAKQTRVAQAAWLGRDWLERRMAIPDLRAPRAIDALRHFAQGEEDHSLVHENRLTEPGKLAFIYSGNGAQWVGMGRQLMAASVVFRSAVHQTAEALLVHGGPDVLQVLAAQQPEAMDDTALAQPALFAVQVGATTLLRSLGLDADAAAGHSVGEIAAAWAVGALDLDTAAQVIVARSKAQALARGTGRMAAVGLSAEAARELLARLGLDAALEIAAINSPRNITLSGDKPALDRLRDALKGQSTFYRELDLDYAFHSRLMDPIRPAIEADLAQLALENSATGAFYSTVTGAPVDADALDAAYWWRNVREPVLFGPTIARMADDGYRIFLEIGPHAVLQRYLDEALQACSCAGRALPTARRDADDLPTFERAVLRAALLGAPVHESAYFPADRAWKQEQLPSYPWQRQRYWIGHTAEGYALIERPLLHPLLGYRLKERPAAWENHLDPVKLPWLADHQVGHAVILPGAAYLELALAAAQDWQPDNAQIVVDRLEILSPVVFDGEHAQTVRVILDPADGRLRIEGRRRLSHDAWALHARCQVRHGSAPQTPPQARIPRIPLPGTPAHVLNGAHLYGLASALGLDYGPAFRGLREIQVSADTLHAQIAWADDTLPAPEYGLHPAVLDQCFQATFAWFEAELTAAARAMAFLPIGMERVSVQQPDIAAFATQLRARLVRRSPRSVLVDFELLDAQDQVLAEVQGVRFRAAALTAPHVLPPAWATQARLTPLEGDPIAATPSPSLAAIAAAIENGFESTDAARFKHFAEELAPLVDALPSAFARDALLASTEPDGKIANSRLNQLRELHPLWNWSIATLQEDGLLRSEGADWRLHPDELPPTAAIWQSALMECPQAWAELLRMARVGESLKATARADFQPQPPLQTPASPLAEALAPAPDIPWYAAAHQAAQNGLRALISLWPSHRRLRILEISVAQSSLIDDLRGDLPSGRTDLVRADANEAQTTRLRAQTDAASAPLITRFDPNSFALDPIDGLPERFDVIVLDHTLHTLADPVTALNALSRLMAADATLLLAERWPDRASNLLHGLSPGWWHAPEKLAGPPQEFLTPSGGLVRSDRSGGAQHGQVTTSLMTPTAWTQALQQAGWQNVQVLNDPVAGAAGLGSYLLLARAPSRIDSEASSNALSNTLSNAPSQPASASPLLLVADPAWQAVADELAVALTPEGQTSPPVLTTTPADAWPCRDTAPCNTALYFPALPPAPTPAPQWADALDAVRRTLLQAAALEKPPCVWIITPGGLLDSGAPSIAPNPAAAALWGMVRVFRNEAPHLPLRLLAAPQPASPQAASALAARIAHAVRHDDGEDEILLTAEGRYAPRIRPVDLSSLPTAAQAAHPAEAWRLDFTLPGQLRNLHWQAAARIDPKDDEIEIEAIAAGLNFRDLMYAMGLLSDEALEQGFAGAALGLEVAGRVVRCGPRVTRFKPGDEVLAFAGASLASHVRVAERAAAPKPAAWSFEQAATVPTVFFTVWYALAHLARLQAGERVLIHAAAGGVGLAAIQVAKRLGAEVFASAGSEDKRTFVRLLGADHVVDSRSPDFDEAVLALTRGEGVDVVLNSLAGLAIERNLHAMRPFGRFIELGKRDFYEDTAIGLRPFRNNISYFGFDADQLMALRPDLSTRVFSEVMEQFAQEHLHPLPYTVFPAEHIVDALRHMQQGRHIGKLLIDLRQRPTLAQPAPSAPALKLQADSNYLVTGGLSGFGLATAHWLVQQGARHLVLLSRRGRATPGAEPTLQALREQGAQVTVLACDVTDAAALKLALSPLGHSLPALRGVIHAAMVLDDALLPNLDAARFASVLAAKIGGAQNLHDATLGMPLDFFVLYSSATVLLGNPGQANYVAANAALEAFARARQAKGLPALAVAWGPIADVGVLTDNAAARDALESRLGAASLQSAQALQALGQLMAQGASDGANESASGLAVMPLDAATLRRALPDTASRRFADLWRMAGSNTSQETDSDLRAHLAQLPPEQAQQTVADMLAEEVAAILRLSVEAVPRARSLHDLGLDSLMAVELGLALEKRFGITLPAMLINDNPTVERIAERVCAGLFGEQSLEAPSSQTQLVQGMAAQHAESGLDAQQVQDLVNDLHAKTQNATRLIA